VTSEVYRFNLEQGCFLRPLTSSRPSINVATINPVNALLAFGGEDGVLECWDYRQKKAIGSLFVGNDVVTLSNGSLFLFPFYLMYSLHSLFSFNIRGYFHLYLSPFLLLHHILFVSVFFSFFH
jgi:WD40 repeat protein